MGYPKLQFRIFFFSFFKCVWIRDWNFILFFFRQLGNSLIHMLPLFSFNLRRFSFFFLSFFFLFFFLFLQKVSLFAHSLSQSLLFFIEKEIIIQFDKLFERPRFWTPWIILCNTKTKHFFNPNFFKNFICPWTRERSLGSPFWSMVWGLSLSIPFFFYLSQKCCSKHSISFILFFFLEIGNGWSVDNITLGWNSSCYSTTSWPHFFPKWEIDSSGSVRIAWEILINSLFND